ncbi:MAG: hypothetical protein J5I90_14820 [Caldilineales bacterium]|nr:hypothetical protein [Caldilineales bacterium]
MPQSVDFNWHEGDQDFDAPDADVQWMPAETKEASHDTGDSVTAATPVPPDVDGKPQKGWSNLALLAVGVILGLTLGVIVLMVQGQRSVRADVKPLVELQQRALAGNDVDLYASLVDPDDQEWREQIPEIIAGLKLIMPDEGVEPKVRSVKFQNDYAEIAVDFSYDGRVYRTLLSAIRVDGKWRLVRARLDGWGDIKTVEGDGVVLHVRERDAFLESYLPEIEAVTHSFCQRYAVPPPCQVDLQIVPNPRLLPFVPGEGAAPPPALSRWRIFGAGDTPLLILNSDGQEGRDPGFQEKLVAYVPEVNSINDFHAARLSPQSDIDISFQRLHERTIPLSLISPRLVGIRGKEVHPLWRLALYEAIGDAIFRRAMGPVTAEDEAIAALWAVARGDVAVWAERFAQVSLPDAAIPDEQSDPAVIGESLLSSGTALRNEARDLALFLHECLGEQPVLDWILHARTEVGAAAMMAPLGISLEGLADAWQQHRTTRQCPLVSTVQGDS